MPALPLTLSHAVRASQPARDSAQRGRLALKRTTGAAVPLPRCASELRASLAVESSLELAVAAGPGHGTMPAAPSNSAASLAAASAAGGGGGRGTPSAGAPGRRTLALELRKQGSRQQLGPKKGSQAGEQAEQQSGSDSGKGGTSYMPRLKVEAQLPGSGAASRRSIAPEDVSYEWQQDWRPWLSSKLGWRHVGAANNDSGGGSGGKKRRRRRRSCGLLLGAPLPSDDAEGSESPLAGSISSVSFGSCATLAAGGSPSLAAAPAGGAAAAKSPQLQCNLTLKLGGGRLRVTGGATVDAGAVTFTSPGAGWGRLPPLRMPVAGSLLGALKSGQARVKLQLGAKCNNSGSGGGSSGGSGGQEGPGALELATSFCAGPAGPCHSAAWLRGGKGGGWDDGQRLRSELRLEVQPAVHKWALTWEGFVPLG